MDPERRAGNPQALPRNGPASPARPMAPGSWPFRLSPFDEPYASTDSGATWSLVGLPPPTTDVACNGDGTRLIVTGAYLADFMMQYSPTSGWSGDFLGSQGSLVASSANGMTLLS